MSGCLNFEWTEKRSYREAGMRSDIAVLAVKGTKANLVTVKDQGLLPGQAVFFDRVAKVPSWPRLSYTQARMLAHRFAPLISGLAFAIVCPVTLSLFRLQIGKEFDWENLYIQGLFGFCLGALPVLAMRQGKD